jgi:hypothetical protein
MSRSTSPANRSRGAKLSGRPVPANSPQARCGAAPPRSSANAGGPEWMTERWKLQVEAEARGRLKKRMRDGASDA